MIDRVLLIDDEANIRELLSRILTLEGFNVDTAENAEKGLKLLEKEVYAVLITDVKLPDVNGVELVKKVKAKYPYIEIIVITAFGNIHDGVDAMKNGAFDYLVKGNDDDKLPLVLRRAFDRAMLLVKVSHLEERINSKFSFSSIIGKSKKISEAIEYAKRVAPTDTTVLLLGETGTGKELFALLLHKSNVYELEFDQITDALMYINVYKQDSLYSTSGNIDPVIGSDGVYRGKINVPHKGTWIVGDTIFYNGRIITNNPPPIPEFQINIE